jgi:hypothetical protein
MADSLVTFGTIDYSGEPSNVRFHVTPLTAGNFAAVNLDITDLGTALDGVSLNTLAMQRVISGEIFLSRAKPANVDAQREKKWLIRYEDTVTHKLYRNEIPGADLALLDTNSDMADLTLTAWTDFIAAFEAVVVSPDGNTVDFIDAQYVGKRL